MYGKIVAVDHCGPYGFFCAEKGDGTAWRMLRKGLPSSREDNPDPVTHQLLNLAFRTLGPFHQHPQGERSADVAERTDQYQRRDLFDLVRRGSKWCENDRMSDLDGAPALPTNKDS